jgi:hypothetical protein
MATGLAGTIQFNHEWTRMDTNKANPRKAFSEDTCRPLSSGYPRPVIKCETNHPIRVNSCPFVVFFCMDTAWSLLSK